MFKVLKIVILISLPFLSGFMDITKGSFQCFDMDEVNVNERKLVDEFSIEFYKALKNKEYDVVRTMLHQDVLGNTGEQNLTKLFEHISARLKDSKSTHLNDMRLIELGGEYRGNPVVCGSVDINSNEYFEVYRLSSSKRFAVAIRDVISDKASYKLSMQVDLIKDDSPKVIGISIKPSQIGGKDKDHYSSLADEFKSKGELIPTYLSNTLAISLGEISDFARNKKFISLFKDAKQFEENHLGSNEFTEWVIKGDKYRIINLSVTSTLSDISPTISYLSHVPLELEALRKETKIIMEYLKERFSSLADISPAILFVAYEELPTDRNKNYRFYRVPVLIK